MKSTGEERIVEYGVEPCDCVEPARNNISALGYQRLLADLRYVHLELLGRLGPKIEIFRLCRSALRPA